MTSLLVYPVILRKPSLTSRNRPSFRVVMVTASGLERKALANFSSESLSASSAYFPARDVGEYRKAADVHPVGIMKRHGRHDGVDELALLVLPGHLVWIVLVNLCVCHLIRARRSLMSR